MSNLYGTAFWDSLPCCTYWCFLCTYLKVIFFLPVCYVSSPCQSPHTNHMLGFFLKWGAKAQQKLMWYLWSSTCLAEGLESAPVGLFVLYFFNVSKLQLAMQWTSYGLDALYKALGVEIFERVKWLNFGEADLGLGTILEGTAPVLSAWQYACWVFSVIRIWILVDKLSRPGRAGLSLYHVQELQSIVCIWEWNMIRLILTW